MQLVSISNLARELGRDQQSLRRQLLLLNEHLSGTLLVRKNTGGKNSKVWVRRDTLAHVQLSHELGAKYAALEERVVEAERKIEALEMGVP